MALDVKRAKSRFGDIGERLYALQDTAIAVHNLRLMAAEMSIRTSWIREVDFERVSHVLGLPKVIKPVALLTMGHSDQPGDSPPMVDKKYYIHSL